MTSYGRTAPVQQTGVSVQALATTGDIDWKVGGTTVDWTTVTAVSGSDVTLKGGMVIPIGYKYLRYGQVICVITASGASQGMYGPYDPAASDGRQTLSRSGSFVVNETVLEKSPTGFTLTPTKHVPCFNGGTVWKARVLATSGVHSLAAGPTFTEFEAVFPDIDYATQDH